MHHDAHGPHHVVAHVRTADALAGLATEERGVVLAPHKAARVLVDGVVHRHVAQIAHRQQRGHVGVVHQQMAAKAVNLESVDLAIFGMLHHGILSQRRLHLVGQLLTLRGQGAVVVHLPEYLGGFPQRTDCHEVGGHEEGEDGGIVARTEHRGDESHGAHGMSPAVPAHGVEGTVGAAPEPVGSQAVAALLLTEGLHGEGDGLLPQVAKDGAVARHAPILMRQADDVAMRVDLIFALMQFGLHVGHVALPLTSRRTVVEGVGIGVDHQAAQLPQYHAAQHMGQLRVVVGKAHVGPHLGTRVAQPHGVDVARIDEGVVLAVGRLAVVHGGLQRVRETVLEHPCQVVVPFQFFLHILDLVVYRLRAEKAVGLGRPFRLQHQGGVGGHADILPAEVGLLCHGMGTADAEK